MPHLYSAPTAPRTMRLHDSGAVVSDGAWEDVLDEHGAPVLDDAGNPKRKLSLDENGLPIELPHGARPAWPEDAGVRTKAMVTGGDWDLMQRLQMYVGINVDRDNPDQSDVDAELRIYWTPLIYFAVFAKSFECKIGPETDEEGAPTGCSNWFEDPAYCTLDEDGNPIPGTSVSETAPRGVMLQVPENVSPEERLEFAKGMHVLITSFVSQKVEGLIRDPLPGTRPAKSTKTR